MKKIILTLMAILLNGCQDSITEQKFPALTGDMADCKIYWVTNGNGAGLTIARCPNSTTTTTQKTGKLVKKSITIDGNLYTLSDKK